MANFDMGKFLEELQARPAIYNPKEKDYHLKRNILLQELGQMFNITG